MLLKALPNISTHILANNVTEDSNIGAFSHTTLNGVGQGSVRIKVILTDPNDQDTIEVMTSVMMRNAWPN